MEGLREFFNSAAGKATALAIVLIGIGAIVWSNWSSSGASAVAAANERIFIDAKTGKPFSVTLKAGMEIPADAPSGGKTGYPAELCYWTADGKPKSEPTAVLLNAAIGKEGPTFCPDCGRLVVGHNPPASPERRPPPTEAEYNARRSNSAAPEPSTRSADRER